MEVWQGTKAEVVFSLAGTDKYTRQSFNDVKEDATEVDMLALGNLMTQIVPTDHNLDGVIGTTRVRYYN